ncbi:carbohydrate ABC transporter permease [Paenibacillus sp. P25]|nr:carbohydrate ABC transporter permease [Paenibacillus sp. P25]
MNNKFTLPRAASSLVLAGLMLFVLYPFIWLFVSTFKTEQHLMAYPPSLLGGAWTIKQYIGVWSRIPPLDFFKNTVIFSGGVTVLSVFFDSMAGYAFARIRFKGGKVLFSLVLLLMMVPFQVLMIPLFLELYKLGLLNTYWGLILPRASKAFGIFMMRSFFVSLPKDLEESGRIDGFSELGIYWKIMLPLCRSAMITLGIFHLMNNWNDLIYPLMLTSSTEMRTLSAGLAMFVGQRTIEYGPTLAASAIALLPPLLIYAAAQKYFVQGIATSGLK